ncbi:MAG: hypothetical protein GX579_12495 [Chloroflexi bacterium]|nr:hypothetical protein [Chloroflexota bacterium]
MMKVNPRSSVPFILTYIVLVVVSSNSGAAQESGQNPTPIIIHLTPPAEEATPTSESAFAPDRFEPNDDAGAATRIGFQVEASLTLVGADVDAFTGFLKADQILQVSATPHGQLDTRLRLIWEGQPVAENDDRAPDDLGSSLAFTAPADGHYVAFVDKVTDADGSYDLETALLAPTATPTPLPTLTPSPTWTPSPTPTLTPTPAPLTQPDSSRSPAGPAPPRATATFSATPTVTATVTIMATEPITLTVRYLGPVEEESDAPATTVRLLVYYDANNDRAPGPGEGIPNVSVLAVDALGQRLAQTFTNTQGEAAFSLHDRDAAAVARIIVPFVPAWSARVRAGEVNDGMVLGLPAVRLPVFFPVAAAEGAETE